MKIASSANTKIRPVPALPGRPKGEFRMIGTSVADHPSAGVLDRLNRASSAEDFFALLGVEYDAKVVNVARLHILRRMAQYLASEDFTAMPDAVVAERCKSVLERAYGDFVASTPID